MGKSKIMKTKHDTAKNSISNVRSTDNALDDDSDGVVDETLSDGEAANATGGVVGGTRTDDLDGDGYAPPIDTDDSDPNINPGATEIPANTLDDDSDGVVDETTSDGHTAFATGTARYSADGTLVDDLDGDGYARPIDTDDGNAEINPGATEIPGNNRDDDSDGVVDETTG